MNGVNMKKINMPIRYIDLFSGIGGFRQGLTLSEQDYECVLSCEIDKSARLTYSTLYGLNKEIDKEEVKEYLEENQRLVGDKELFFDDVVELSEYTTDELKLLFNYSNKDKTIQYDMLCGGFPCQPFSRSGKRHAFNDVNKGNLFFSVLNIIKKTNPQYVILENVKGLLTVGENVIVDDENSFGFGIRSYEIEKGRTFLDILYLLVEAGYDVEWQVLNSNRILPHKRERVYIVAKKKGESHRVMPMTLSEHQNTAYKEIAKRYREISNDDLLKIESKSMSKYIIDEAETSLELIECIKSNENKRYKFTNVTPFKSWGRAFDHDLGTVIVTEKLDDNLDNYSYKMLDYLETDYKLYNRYLVGHLNIIKQIWSKSAKTVSTGNKMGNMSFPDSVSKPSRTLTATGALGREAMVIGFFIKNGRVHFIESLKNRDQLLYLGKDDFKSDVSQPLINKFKERGNKQIKKSRTNLLKVDVEYLIENKLKSIQLDYDLELDDVLLENKLYFRTLNPSEMWKLQGFLHKSKRINKYYNDLSNDITSMDDLINLVGKNQLQKQAGNAVTVNLISEIGNRLL